MASTVHIGERGTFSSYIDGVAEYAYRRMKPAPHLSPCTKIHWETIKDLIVRINTLKLPQEGITQVRQETGIVQGFLKRTLNTAKNNPKNWQAGLHESKMVLQYKGNSVSIKRKSTVWEKNDCHLYNRLDINILNSKITQTSTI